MHKAHRDHDFKRWKLTLCLSPSASGCVHTGSWESQRVIPGRSRLTLEEEKTAVPSDGQWIAFTPWSNAVNSHLWGFGKVPHTQQPPYQCRTYRAVAGCWPASKFAGATDGATASQLGLQLVFVLGVGQSRKFVEWLVTELMK